MDVSLDCGFGIEVLDSWIFAVGELGDVQEGRPDEVLNTRFLGVSASAH